MVSKEEISMVGFTIVAYAGDAKTDLLNALKLAREGKFEEAEKLIEARVIRNKVNGVLVN